MSLSKKELAIRQKLKDDFPHYSKKCLKIRTKEHGLQPFKLNKAQQFLHEEAERQLAERGYVRSLVVKGRQQGCCLSPDTLITKSNLSVCTIDDLQVGDDVLSLDEYGAKGDGEKKKSTRKMRTAKVEAKAEFLSELFEIKLTNGTTLKATGNHRWLTQKRGGTDMVWRDVDSLKVGDTLRAATFNDGFIDRDFRDGWIAGLLDADGSCSTTGVPRISFSQVDGDVLDGYKGYLRDYGVGYYENIDRRTKVGGTTKLGDKPVHCVRVDSFPHIVRLISRANPVRFSINGIYEGRKLPTTSSTFEALPKVLSIRSLGVQRVVDIQTSEKTFIANGIVSHNSTYIGGRFYWKVSHQKGKRAYILTHEGEATANLFDMTTRYHQNVPEIVRPSTDRDSGKELHFDKLDSGYKVGTAGAKETGRSQTIQYFHGCLSGDSLVILADGTAKPMSEVKRGDLVVTSSGCTARVKHKVYTGKKQTYTLSCWVSGEPIHATADHKVLTDSGYKRLGDMSKDDWVAMPDTRTRDCMDVYYYRLKNKQRPQGGGSKHNEFHGYKLTEDFGYFLGYYLAEGHVKDNLGYISFCYHKDEVYIDRALSAVDGIYTSVSHKVVGNRGVTNVYGKFLASAVNEMCGRVEGKHIPEWFFNAPKLFLEGVLRGYLDGDGSKTQLDKVSASSIHEKIARQIQRIWWATYGACSISKHERSRYNVKTKDVYLTRSSGNSFKRYLGLPEGLRKEKTKVVDGVVYCKVKLIEPRVVESVWDIEVDHPDHNYQTSVGVVSNSEVAFWPNAKTHARGVMQAIPKQSGEVWLESTSDGEGNYFAEMWRDAVLGKNDFVPVFIPWLWQEEYKSDVESLSKTDDEKEYCEIALDVHGIHVSDEQLQFRREKISELGGIEAFMREYPLTPEEAFSNQGVNQLIPTDKVRKALTTELLSEPVGASILGVDVARYGDDRSVWTHRIGRYMKVLKVVEKASLTEITGITKMILDSWNYQACFIDMGMGAGVVDMLHEMGYVIVEGVNFGGEPFNKDLYPNKRNEMFGEFIEWLSDEPVCIDAKDQEEADAILMESAAIQYKFDSKSRKIMESKDDMKKRLGFSNDLTDSMVLTFTRPVVKYHEETYQQPIVRHSKTGY